MNERGRGGVARERNNNNITLEEQSQLPSLEEWLKAKSLQFIPSELLTSKHLVDAIESQEFL
jgi:hypothetical protein